MDLTQVIWISDQFHCWPAQKQPKYRGERLQVGFVDDHMQNSQASHSLQHSRQWFGPDQSKSGVKNFSNLGILHDSDVETNRWVSLGKEIRAMADNIAQKWNKNTEKSKKHECIVCSQIGSFEVQARLSKPSRLLVFYAFQELIYRIFHGGVSIWIQVFMLLLIRVGVAALEAIEIDFQPREE